MKAPRPWHPPGISHGAAPGNWPYERKLATAIVGAPPAKPRSGLSEWQKVQIYCGLSSPIFAAAMLAEYRSFAAAKRALALRGGTTANGIDAPPVDYTGERRPDLKHSYDCTCAPCRLRLYELAGRSGTREPPPGSDPDPAIDALMRANGTSATPSKVALDWRVKLPNGKRDDVLEREQGRNYKTRGTSGVQKRARELALEGKTLQHIASACGISILRTGHCLGHGGPAGREGLPGYPYTATLVYKPLDGHAHLAGAHWIRGSDGPARGIHTDDHAAAVLLGALAPAPAGGWRFGRGISHGLDYARLYRAVYHVVTEQNASLGAVATALGCSIRTVCEMVARWTNRVIRAPHIEKAFFVSAHMHEPVPLCAQSPPQEGGSSEVHSDMAATQTQVSAVDLAKVRGWCGSGAARAIREAAQLKMAEVARHVGVDQGTVSRWETGAALPTGEAAIEYLHLLEELCRPASPLRHPSARYAA